MLFRSMMAQMQKMEPTVSENKKNKKNKKQKKKKQDPSQFSPEVATEVEACGEKIEVSEMERVTGINVGPGLAEAAAAELVPPPTTSKGSILEVLD